MWHTQPFDTFPVKVVLGEIERRVNLLASTKAKNMQEAHRLRCPRQEAVQSKLGWENRWFLTKINPPLSFVDPTA